MVVPLPCLEACDTVSTAPLITPKSLGGRPDDSPPHELGGREGRESVSFLQRSLSNK